MGTVYKISAEHYGSGLVIPTAITFDDRRLVHIRKILRYEQKIDGQGRIQRYFCAIEEGKVCLSLNHGTWTLDASRADIL